MLAVNKVIKRDGTILLNLCDDTVSSGTLVRGITAHDYTGNTIEGTLNPNALHSSSDTIKFIDYDGTLLYQYTLDEINQLTELPPLPSHEGLICQGWNWSLEGLKALGRSMIVGASYTTDDGSTKLYIKLGYGRKCLRVGLGVNGSVQIDWGDGTPYTTLTGTTTSNAVYTDLHEYGSFDISTPNDYVIRIIPDEGTSINFIGDGSTTTLGTSTLRFSEEDDTRNKYYQNSIWKVHFGKGIQTLAAGMFRCESLKYATLPVGVTYLGWTFHECALESITLPRGMTQIAYYTFVHNHNLKSVSLCEDMVEIHNSFNGCTSLQELYLPNTIQAITATCFTDCKSLEELYLPDSINTDISEIFTNNTALRKVRLPQGLTYIPTFYGCSDLEEIILPNAPTNMKSYYDCHCLKEITIPEGTSVIEDHGCANCHSASAIVLPSTLQTIKAQAFAYNHGVRVYNFTQCTQVPTLEDQAFTEIAPDCIIFVPQSLFNQWVAATNWTVYASQITY